MYSYIKIDEDTFGKIATPNPQELVHLSDLVARKSFLENKINAPTHEELLEAYYAQHGLSSYIAELSKLTKLIEQLQSIE